LKDNNCALKILSSGTQKVLTHQELLQYPFE
jgi:hypothetical protein